MLYEGQQVELTIEKPASGGRMIARHLGQVVLVRGAIPGERVTAWIERAEKRLAYAVTREVLEASPDRVESARIRCAAACSTRTSPTSASSRSSETSMRDAFARVGRHPISRSRSRSLAPGRRLPHAGPAPRPRGTRGGSIGKGPINSATPAATRQLLTAALRPSKRCAPVSIARRPACLTSISITENVARRSARRAPRACRLARGCRPSTLADARARPRSPGSARERCSRSRDRRRAMPVGSRSAGDPHAGRAADGDSGTPRGVVLSEATAICCRRS